MNGRPDLYRGGAAILAAAALILGAAGCTTVGYKCVNETCEITLSGEGASSDLGGERQRITLVSIEDGVATIDLAGSQGVCSSGETIELAEATIECTKVDNGSVELTVTGV